MLIKNKMRNINITFVLGELNYAYQQKRENAERAEMALNNEYEMEHRETLKILNEAKEGHYCDQSPCATDHAEGFDVCTGCHCKKL